MEEIKMSKDYWDGSYETSKWADRSLEEMFEQGFNGTYAYPLKGGKGTVVETPNSINVYQPDPSSPDGHSHEGVNRNGQHYKK